MFACSLILTFILIQIILMFIFIHGSKRACVYSIELYKVHLYAQITCLTTCAISRHFCVVVQHTAFACEVQCYLGICYIHRHTAVHIHYSDWTKHQSRVLKLEGNLLPCRFTCGRRLCTAGFTFAPQTELLLYVLILFFVCEGCTFKSLIVCLLLSWMYFTLHWVLSLPPCWHRSANDSTS